MTVWTRCALHASRAQPLYCRSAQRTAKHIWSKYVLVQIQVQSVADGSKLRCPLSSQVYIIISISQTIVVIQRVNYRKAVLSTLVRLFTWGTHAVLIHLIKKMLKM